jgi:hypothetical protein
LDGAEEVASELIITGSDASEVFQTAEAALDDIPALVGALLETVESYSVGLVWDDRLCTAVDDVGAEVSRTSAG